MEKTRAGLQCPFRNKGSSLIEVMVAVILATTALVGFAAIQANTRKIDYQASFRAIAALSVGDMAERMRANQQGVSQGAYSSFMIEKPAVPDCRAAKTTCSPVEMATFDLWHWNYRNSVNLPYGKGIVTRTGTEMPMTYAVSVGWGRAGAGQPREITNHRPCDSGEHQGQCLVLKFRL